MMNRLILVGIASVILVLNSAHSAEPTLPACRAVAWPFFRQQASREIYKQMKALDRRDLIEYYFGELTIFNSKNMANDLGLYLAQTELDKDRRDFYRFLSAGSKSEPKSHQKYLALSEICEVFTKIEKTKLVRPDRR